MKQIIISSCIVVLSWLLISQIAFSQNTKNICLEGSGSLNVMMYDGDPMLGLGAHVRLLRPVNRNGYALVGGADFDILDDINEYTANVIDYTSILALVGYRKIIKSFYIEPHLGGGLFKEEDYNSPCIFIGLEQGIQKRQFNYSIDFRFISADGILGGDHFYTFSLKFGYRFIRNKDR